jgi:hypothetical protein
MAVILRKARTFDHFLKILQNDSKTEQMIPAAIIARKHTTTGCSPANK